MSTTFVDAITVDKEKPKEKTKRKLALSLYVVFQASINTSDFVTKDAKNFWNTIQGLSTSQEYEYQQYPNANAIPIPENYDKIEDFVVNSVPLYETKCISLRLIKQTIKQCHQKIDSYLIGDYIEAYQVHVFIICIDVPDPISLIFCSDISPSKEYVDENFKNAFKNIKPLNDKIEYCEVDYAGIFNKCEVHKWNDITTDKNRPTSQEIIDAMQLCQLTYDVQTPLDESIIAAAVSLWSSSPDSEKTQERLNSLRSSVQQNGWTLANDSELNKLGIKGRLKNMKSGFYSKLFVKYDSNRGCKVYMYCTAGTNMTSITDWYNNFVQGLFGLSEQYTFSVHNALLLDKNIGKDDVLIFAGHSLGGGLASNNAIVTDTRYGITFNAAGLSPARLCVTGTSALKNALSIWQYADSYKKNKDKAEQRIYAFVIEGEILNSILAPFNETALGHVNEIKLEKTLPATAKHKLLQFIDNKEVAEQINEAYANHI